jgi:hypothetical protein
MRLVNYNELSMNELIDKYWYYEIEISKLASEYHQTEEYIIENSHILTPTDKHKLGVLLWEVVNCLQCYNARKKSLLNVERKNNIIPFPQK